MNRRVVRPRLIRCHCGQVNEARAEWCIRCLRDFEAEQRRKGHTEPEPQPTAARQ